MNIIACLGGGSVGPDSPIYQTAQELGRLLAKRGFVVITGGFSGVMEAAAKGAKEADGQTIGYTMLGKPGNNFLTQTVDCQTTYGLTYTTTIDGRKVVTAINPPQFPSPEVQYGIRLGSLMQAKGFVVVAGGGSGTMVELLAIVNFNLKLWTEKPKRLAILTVPGVPSGRWDNNMLDQLEQLEVLPPKIRRLIRVTAGPERAADWVTSQGSPQ